MKKNLLNLRLLRHFVFSSSNGHQENAYVVCKRNSCDFLVERHQYSHWKSRKKGWNNEHNSQFSYFLLRILSALPAIILYSCFVAKESLCDSDAELSKNRAAECNPDIQLGKKLTAPIKKNEENVASESPKKGSKETLPTLPNGPNKSEKKDVPIVPSLLESTTLKSAIHNARILIWKKVLESGAPGMSIAVSIDGEVVWREGRGFSDVENGIKMTPLTVMRVASISKSLTMVAVCQLIEEGKLDLDLPIQTYVPSFPQKTVDGEQVVITTRHLLNHTSGIRHYKLKDEIRPKKGKEKETKTEMNLPLIEKNEENPSLSVDEKREKIRKLLSEKSLRNRKRERKENEFDLAEYFIKEEFQTVQEALQLFQYDDLLFKPGEEYYYTSHGWTLVSAVVEAAAGKPFAALMTQLFEDMGMHDTMLDKHEPIIFNRSRYYYRNALGELKNSPYVDNSYKWAGGGFLSNVIDLLNFGNLMLYSYQNTDDAEPKGFLKASTVRSIWTPSPPVSSGSNPKTTSYGLGWVVGKGDQSARAFAEPRKFFASHTGGAIGASSVLLVIPSDEGKSDSYDDSELPRGIVIAILTNQQGVSLHKLALHIARIFQCVEEEENAVGSINGVSRVFRVKQGRV